MARIRWTPQAADDLEAIFDFIARDSPGYARIFTSRIVNSIGRLADFPLSGREVPEIGNERLREIIVGNYRIVYSSVPEAVTILTIYHAARLLDASRLDFD